MSESDIEMLHNAAKAAGLHVKGYRVNADDDFEALLIGPKFTKHRKGWNPLTDDGDAFRLAVQLNLMHGKMFSRRIADSSMVGDIYAATRRAIVRAAAEIGRELP